MGEFEEETYSTVFAALRHPLRRRLLRTLSQSSRTFTDMQNSFNVNSAVLTHHLDSMKELICKTVDGQYTLSTMGEGALALMERVEEPPKTTPTDVPSKTSRRLKILQSAAIFAAFILLVSGTYLTSISSVQIFYDLPYESISMKVPTQIGGNLYDTSINTTVAPPTQLFRHRTTDIYIGFRTIENITSGDYKITLNYLEYSPANDLYTQKQIEYSGGFLPVENEITGAVFSAYLAIPFNATAERESLPRNIVISIWTNTTAPHPSLLLTVKAAVLVEGGGYVETRPYEREGSLIVNIGLISLITALIISVLSFARKHT